MATESYRVLADELTLHQDVRALTNPMTGETVGYQRGRGRTYVEDDVISGDQVASIYKDALANSDHPLHESLSKKLQKVSDEPKENLSVRLGVPFEDYDEMEAEEVVRAMSVLPSATIQRIKEYESANKGREEIVNYDIGFGVHPKERMNTKLEPPEPDEDKTVREITTTDVDTESGDVELGEGVTGTGMPQVAHGAKKAASEGRKPAARRGRRARTTTRSKPAEKENENEN